MTGNTFGDLLRVTTFGESHGPALGVVLDGVPAGLPLTESDLLADLARRRPGQSKVTTARQESDTPEILSGVFEGRTTGTPIAIIVRNSDQRSGDYDHLRAKVRPGHGDETYNKKYGHRDHRGGGRSSGRETVARVLAGSVAKLLLPELCVIRASALQVGPLQAESYNPEHIEQNSMRCADEKAGLAMEALVLDLKSRGDSVGGRVGLQISGVAAGLGEPVFDKLEAKLGAALLSIGAVTSFAYGLGSDVATAQGLSFVENRSNFGGILGGISTGETITIEVAVKPTSSVADIAKRGRHDPCIVPRIIPVIEAMAAITIADLNLRLRTSQKWR